MSEAAASEVTANARVAGVAKEALLSRERVFAFANEYDGCLHVIRTYDHRTLVQLHPLSPGEAFIGSEVKDAGAKFEFVFRPPTPREVVVFKKRQKTVKAEEADTDLFRGCIVFPPPETHAETISNVLGRFAMLFNSKKFVHAMLTLAGDDIDSGKD